MSTLASGERVGDYRAFMTCGAKDGWLGVVEQELRAWMHKKYRLWEIDLSADGSHVLCEQGLRGTRKSHVSFDVRRQSGAGGESLRARLTEVDDSGATWSTELIAHDHRGDGDWVWLTVTNDEGRFVSVPGLAKNLMGALPLTDSTMQFVPEPQLHRHHDVDDVVDMLSDEDRHGLVFVAGTDNVGRSVDDFTRLVSGWTREAYGLAQVIVLDPLATAEFNRQVGPGHAAKAWSIRTYHPGAIFGDPSDGRRHRYLTRATQSGDVQRLLGVIARGHAANRQLPSGVERIRRSFERLENAAILEALVTASPRPTLPGLEAPQAELPFKTKPAPEHAPAAPRPPRHESHNATQQRLPIPGADAPESSDLARSQASSVAGQAESYLAQIELVKVILGIEQLDEAVLQSIAEDATRPTVPPEALRVAREKIGSQERLINELRDTGSALQEALEDEQLSHVDTQTALDKARDTERWLRSRLAQLEAHDEAYAEVPVSWRARTPESFSELLDLLEDETDPVVVFTGDADITLALEANDPGTACRAAWDAILVLRDYVRARQEVGFDGSVDHYVKFTPSGFAQCPSRKHAHGETATTMQQWGHERVFPVPMAVHPEGRVRMSAHFRLAQIGRISPRLHYYDDYLGTGKIYVGYIGPHLTNTQS